MPAGFIYCFQNECFKYYADNRYKLGKTKRKAPERVDDYKTGYAEDSVIIHSEPVADINKAENMLFDLLSEYRVRSNREFFEVDSEIIIDKMKKVASELPKLEDKTQNKINHKIIGNKNVNMFCLRCGYTSPGRSHNVKKHLNNKKDCVVKYLDISREKILNHYEKCCTIFVTKVEYDDTFPEYIKSLYKKINLDKITICDQCGTTIKCEKNIYRHKKLHCPERHNINNKVKELEKQVKLLQDSINTESLN